MIASTRSSAIQRLIEVGLIPPQCTRFELIAEVGHVVKANITFLLTEEQLDQVAEAFERNPEEANGIVRQLMAGKAK